MFLKTIELKAREFSSEISIAGAE